jgi:UDP-2,4-diacetamido-2,4,6-trideoxy-beta-L-altropyranose hydrolase
MVKVAIRADASIAMGTGHLVRCMALAGELMDLGAQVHFITRPDTGEFHKRLSGAGFRVHLLSSASADEPIMEVATFLGASDAWGWLVVDHYGIDQTAHAQWRPLVKNIAVIDDLANRHHDCDVLIDQNYSALHGERYQGLVPPDCRQLLGPHYALLRPAFGEARQRALATSAGGGDPASSHSRVRRLLVSFGGSDPANISGLALAALSQLRLKGIQVEVLAGAANPHYEQLLAMCAAEPDWQLHTHIDDPSAIMERADLVIGAGGGTTWERCCLGLPAIVIGLADNQHANAGALAADGYQVYMGDAGRVSEESIAGTVRVLIENAHWRRHLGSRCRSLVDGRGAQRCARVLAGGGVGLRRAQDFDCLSVLAWRNAPENRENSLDPKPLGEAEHQRWYAATLSNPDRELLIAESDGDAVGVLRYDISGKCALVSIFLVPGEQGKGYGLGILAAGETWLREHRPGVEELQAEILESNLTQGFPECRLHW